MANQQTLQRVRGLQLQTARSFPHACTPQAPGKSLVRLDVSGCCRAPQAGSWSGDCDDSSVLTRAQALQDYLDELTDRSDVCQCPDTLKFLNADEHNTAIKHAIQEDVRRAFTTNMQTEETRCKLQAREQENSRLHSEIDSLQREVEAVRARCESCETDINSLRPYIVKQVTPLCTRLRCALKRFSGGQLRS